MRYHHLGIPTTHPQPGETYLAAYKTFCTDHERNPFGIQWMRYEPDCPLPELVRTVPHVAFEVDDLAAALVGPRDPDRAEQPVGGRAGGVRGVRRGAGGVSPDHKGMMKQTIGWENPCQTNNDST